MTKGRLTTNRGAHDLLTTDRFTPTVTWFAQVDQASTSLATKELFGQVRSGVVILTGHLGVMRIVKDEVDGADNLNGTLVDDTGTLEASWDTWEMVEQFNKSGIHSWDTSFRRYSTYRPISGSAASLHSSDVFFVPVRKMKADHHDWDYEVPVLTGLFLLPTGSKNGYYKRVGQFEFSERVVQRDEADKVFDHLTRSTGLTDPRYFVSKQKRGRYTIAIV